MCLGKGGELVSTKGAAKGVVGEMAGKVGLSLLMEAVNARHGAWPLSCGQWDPPKASEEGGAWPGGSSNRCLKSREQPGTPASQG